MLGKFEIQAIEKAIINKRDLNKKYNNYDVVGQNVIKIGFEIEQANLTFVQYELGKFSYMHKPKFNIGVSDEFMGCAFVLFKKGYDEYVGHLAIDETHNWDDKSWNTFIKNNNLEVCQMFYPYYGRVKELMFQRWEDVISTYNTPCDCIGIIDELGLCYSAIFDNIEKRIVYVQIWSTIDNSFWKTQKDGFVIYDITKEYWSL